jgi:hypothetical protein
LSLKPYSAIRKPAVRSSLRVAFPNQVLPEQNDVHQRLDFRAR